MTHRHIDVCKENGIADSDIPVCGALALADAGLCDRAVELLQARIDEAEQLGRIGFAAGVIYEARARVAIVAGDSRAFEEFSGRCAREYEKSNNPTLAVRLNALIEAARDHGLIARPELTEVSRSLRAMAADEEQETLQSRLEECVGAADRSRCALTLLLQNTLSRLGYLYLTAEGKRLALTAFLPDEPTDAGVGDWVHACAVAWCEAANRRDEFVTQSMEGATQSAEAVTVSNEGLDESTASGAIDHEPEITLNYVDEDGRCLHAVLLVCGTGSSGVLAGVLVVQAAASEQVYLPQTFTSALAAELLRCGDAKNWT
jgi:hypothetical protein